MTAPKIKACPDCGSADHMSVYTYDNGGYGDGPRHVECDNGRCQYIGPAASSVIKAIKAHNAKVLSALGEHP